MEEYMLPCMNTKLFGVECMGCGTQRAAYMVSQGNFVDKKRKYHKIIIFLAILNAVIMVFAYIYKHYKF